MSSDGKFEVMKVTALCNLRDGEEKELPESDLTIQTEEELIQFKYIDPDREKKKFTIKPGCFSIEDTALGTVLEKFTLRDYDLLNTIDNTSTIEDEASKFFDKLEVYKELGREPKRSLLLCSVPGVGKTAAINSVCKKFLEDSGTSVVIWDTSSLRSSVVSKFFLNRSQYSKKVKRMILIIEDVEGGTVEEYGGAKSADSSLLNLLDGVGTPFKGIPTFIIATTNNPEQSVGALIDRPGRFDKVVEMKTPNQKECLELLKFISKQELSEDDQKAAEIAAKEKFSIAHLQEIVVRSKLDDISMLEAAEQLKDHKKRFKDAFKETKPVGMGLSRG